MRGALAMTEPRYSYDDECEVLALHFLDVRPDPKDISDLAQALQDAVEMWFAGRPRADVIAGDGDEGGPVPGEPRS